MKKKVVILGGHGDGIVVAQAIKDIEKFDNSMELIGFLNDNLDPGDTIWGYPVITNLDNWKILDNDIYIHAALHKVKEMKQRVERILNLNIPKERMVNVIHPRANISDDIKIGVGCYIGPNVTVQPSVHIGNCVTIRAGANIGHDGTIEDFSYVGPNSTMSGRSILKYGSHLGPNAVIADRVIVGNYSVLGIGAALTVNAEDNSIYYGNPARKIASL